MEDMWLAFKAAQDERGLSQSWVFGSGDERVIDDLPRFFREPECAELAVLRTTLAEEGDVREHSEDDVGGAGSGVVLLEEGAEEETLVDEGEPDVGLLEATSVRENPNGE
jgi:hypothetical protein